MSKKSVSDVWKELNSRPLVGRTTPSTVTSNYSTNGEGVQGTLGGLSGFLNLPGLQSKVRILPSKSAATSATASAVSSTLPGGTAGPTLEDVPIHSSRAAAVSYDPSQAGSSSEEVHTFMSSIQRTVNCLSDPDRNLRRQAAITLHARLTSPGTDSQPRPSAQLLQALMCGALLHPVLGLLRDPVDRCRTLGVSMLADAFGSVDASPALSSIIPELLRRMGTLPVAETSEEIRLQLSELVATLVSRNTPSALSPYAADLCTLLARAIEDPFHDIKKCGCGCLVTLAQALPAGALQPHSAALVSALVADLQHPHSRVRGSIISALHALVVRDGVEAGVVESSIAVGVRPVAHDRSVAVRQALFDALASWLGCDAAAAAALATAAATGIHQSGSNSSQQDSMQTEAAVRARTYAPALLPLLLMGVTDPQASVSTHVLQLVERVGESWAGSHTSPRAASLSGVAEMETEELSSNDNSPATADSEDSAMHEALPRTSSTDATQGAGAGSESQTGAAAAMPSDSCLSRSVEDSSVNAAVAACRLPVPYTGRPSAGCRAMVQSLLPQLLPPLIRDLSEWTVGQRSAASRALHTTLVLAEAGSTAHLLPLLPALCNAIGDEDAEVAGRIIGCVHVLGAHVKASRWLPLILDHLCSARLTVTNKANTLVVLSGLLHAAGNARQSIGTELLAALAGALAAEEVRGSDHPAVRQQLLAVTVNAVAWAGAGALAVAEPLLSVLLQLYGFESDPSRREAVAAGMSQLAVGCGVPGIGELLEVYAVRLLTVASADAKGWTSDSANYLVMRALLLLGTPATLGQLLPAVAAVLHPILQDAERDSALRLSILQMVDTLLEDPNRGPAIAGDPHTATLLRLVLLPPLIWRAGKVAAAERFAGVTALASLLRCSHANEPALLLAVMDGTLLPLMSQCLDEDWYPAVRLAACQATALLLRRVGSGLGGEQRRVVYPELLKRLDDSNNAVRVAACEALVVFAETMGDYDDTNTGYVAEGVIIHMDDSDPGVQEAACKVMEALATAKPAAVAKEVRKVQERFRSRQCIARVLAACGVDRLA